MVASLPRPGTEVIQEFRTVSPTILRPGLVPVIVGPCYEIVDLLDSTGAVNSEAAFTTPARMVGDAVGPNIDTTGAYNVSIRINGGATQDYALPLPDPAASYSLELAASYLQTNITGLVAYVDPTKTQLNLETLAKGSNASLELMTPASASAYTVLGINAYEGLKQVGTSSYINSRVESPFTAFPTILGDIDQMDIIEDDIRLYILVGGTAVELDRDQAVLRNRYNQSTTSLRMNADLPERDVDLFPQALFSHQLKVIDDGDADGVSPWYYAPGTNALYLIGDDDDNQLLLEAWGDQDSSNYGPYHGLAGNSLEALVNPSAAATDVMLSVSGTQMDLYPYVQITITTTGTPTVGESIQNTAAAGTPDWTAKIGTVTATGTTNEYELLLYNLQAGASGGYPDAAGYTAIKYATTTQVWEASDTWTTSAYAFDDIVTTASEMRTALLADAGASNLVVPSLIGDGTDAMVPNKFDQYLLGTVGGVAINDLKRGDIIIEDTGPNWAAVILDIDTSGPDLLVKSIKWGAVASVGVPQAADNWDPLSSSGTGTGTTSTVTDGLELYDKLTGGRDPVDFSNAPSTGDEVEVTSTLPYSPSTDGDRFTAALMKISGATGGFTRGNLVQLNQSTDYLVAPILQVGTDYLIIGVNARSGGVGESIWPQSGDTVTELGGPANGYQATSVTASVSEFHTVVYVTSATGSAPAVGDTAFNIATSQAIGTVEKAVLKAGTSDEYYVALSNLALTVKGLPTGAATWTGGSGTVTTHDVKTLPTAGATLYLSLLGSTPVQVDFDGAEIDSEVYGKINTAVAATGLFANVVGTFLTLDASQTLLGTDNPLNWRDNLGMEASIALSGDSVKYLFGDAYTLATTLDAQDYPASVQSYTWEYFKHFAPPFAVGNGDLVYDGTTLLGTVASVENLNIGGQVFTGAKLVLDTEDTSGNTFNYWYVRADNLEEGVSPALYDPDRPYPELSIYETLQSLLVRHDVAVGYDGVTMANASVGMYLTYTGLRLDVTSEATNPELLVIEDTTDLENRLGPISPENPLAWGVYAALQNAPGVAVSALGVDAVSANSPMGTLLAYTRAAEFLESEEVYAIAPLTQDRLVHQMWKLHVEDRSEPENKGERVVIVNVEQPTEKEPTLVGSGTGESNGTNVVVFDQNTINVTAALQAAGIDPLWTPTQFRDAGVYIDITSDNLHYLVSQVNGQTVTCTVSHAPGQNDDAFYSSTNMPTLTTGGETCTIYERGAAITNIGDITEALADIASGFDSRRTLFVQPDLVGMTYQGSEVLVPGYYTCCGIAGMTAGFLPSQGFTRFPMTGYTRVKNAQDKFKEEYLAQAAAGGVYWVVQDAPGAPILCRHQLTTDMTSIETREYSITKQIDFGAKFIRINTKNYIGIYNITKGFLDTLSVVLQGCLTYLVSGEIWGGAELNNLIQDEDDPDTVLVDVTVDPLYPANYIRVTIVI